MWKSETIELKSYINTLALRRKNIQQEQIDYAKAK